MTAKVGFESIHTAHDYGTFNENQPEVYPPRQGMDRPSENQVRFNSGSEAEISIMVATTKNAKPGLTVPLEYAEFF